MTLSRVNVAIFDKRGHTSLNKPLIIRRIIIYNKRIALIKISDKCIRLKTGVYGTSDAAGIHCLIYGSLTINI